MSVPKFLLYVNEDMLRLHLNIVELILMNIRQVEQLRKLQNQENVCQFQKSSLGILLASTALCEENVCCFSSDLLGFQDFIGE